jgi:hypothetical protein
MSDDLVKRARACANGIGNTMTNSGDYGLFDDLADRIEALEAENARLREALEDVISGYQLWDIDPESKVLSVMPLDKQPSWIRRARAALTGGKT